MASRHSSAPTTSVKEVVRLFESTISLSNNGSTMLLAPPSSPPSTPPPPLPAPRPSSSSNPPKDPPNASAIHKIPRRVDSKYAIEIKESNISGAGRGIFVKEAVPAGTTIFRVNSPLLTIINCGEEAESKTCDNCLSSILDADLSNIPWPNELDFALCGGCMVYSYCSKRCQLEAWSHHHVYECSILTTMLSTYPSMTPEILRRSFRTMIRLLCLLQNNRISRKEWGELRQLQSRPLDFKAEKAHRSDDWLDILVATNNLKRFVGTELDFDEIEELMFAMDLNHQPIHIPLFRYPNSTSPSATDLRLSSTHPIGSIIDPFLALLNHSCIPNTTFHCEGKSLHVISTQSIPANSELFISYLGASSGSGTEIGTQDFLSRCAILEHRWGIKCTCDFCKDGSNPDLPVGSLRDLLLKTEKEIRVVMKEKDNEDEEDNSIDARKVVEETFLALSTLSNTTLPKGIWPSWQLNYLAMLVEKEVDGVMKALKRCLELYLCVEPVMKPRVEGKCRVNTLFNLVQLVGMLVVEESEQGVHREGEKGVEWELLGLQLRERYVEQTEKCFGAEATVTGFERQVWSDLVQEFEGGKGKEEGKGKGKKKEEGKGKYVGLRESKVEEEKFVERVNRLLVVVGSEYVAKIGEI